MAPNDPLTSEFLRGSAELVVLSLLQRRPMHGYGLYTSLTELDSTFSLTPATLYPLLYRLERAGWILGTWEEGANGRRQKIYALTKEGQRTLASRLAHWKRFTGAVNTLLTQPLHA